MDKKDLTETLKGMSRAIKSINIEDKMREAFIRHRVNFDTDKYSHVYDEKNRRFEDTEVQIQWYKWQEACKWQREQYSIPEWISVEDGLPESKQMVLAVSGDLICTDLFVKGSFVRNMGVEVTHWMPLPQPPTGESK